MARSFVLGVGVGTSELTAIHDLMSASVLRGGGRGTVRADHGGRARGRGEMRDRPRIVSLVVVGLDEVPQLLLVELSCRFPPEGGKRRKWRQPRHGLRRAGIG